MLFIIIAFAAILCPLFCYRQSVTNPLVRRYLDLSLCVSAITLAIPVALRARRKQWLLERGLSEEEDS